MAAELFLILKDLQSLRKGKGEGIISEAKGRNSPFYGRMAEW